MSDGPASAVPDTSEEVSEVLEGAGVALVEHFRVGPAVMHVPDPETGERLLIRCVAVDMPGVAQVVFPLEAARALLGAVAQTLDS